MRNIVIICALFSLNPGVTPLLGGDKINMPFGLKVDMTTEQVISIMEKKGFVFSDSTINSEGMWTELNFELTNQLLFGKVPMETCTISKYKGKIFGANFISVTTGEVEKNLDYLRELRRFLSTTYGVSPTIDNIGKVERGADMMDHMMLLYVGKRCHIGVFSKYNKGFYLQVGYSHSEIFTKWTKDRENARKRKEKETQDLLLK